jgi:hypothetical protein
LRDPIWQFVGAVLGLIAIMVSLAIYYFQKANKDLSEVLHKSAQS